MSKDKKIVSYPDSIDTRVALLEMSIGNINETIKEIKSELKEMRIDMNSGFREIWQQAQSNFKGLLRTIFGLATFFTGAIIGLGTIMAHGFHWF